MDTAARRAFFILFRITAEQNKRAAPLFYGSENGISGFYGGKVDVAT